VSKVLVPGSDDDGQYVTLPVLGRSYPLTGTVAEVGSIIDALSLAFWVDAGSVSSVENGSIAAPYKTMQAAHDAAVSLGRSVITLLVVSASNQTLTTAIQTAVVGIWNASDVQWSFGIGPLTCNAKTSIANISINTSLTAAANVALFDCNLNNASISAAGFSVFVRHCAGAITTLSAASFIVEEPSTVVVTGAVTITSAITFRSRYSEASFFTNGTPTFGGFVAERCTDLPFANIVTDANQVMPGDSPTRFIYPKSLLTANRTLTLQNTGTAVRKSVMIDVYNQGFTLSFIDQTSGATLTVYPAAGSNYRYVFNYDGVNTWAFGNRFRLQA
jgi:hypothetical protein